MSDQNPYQSWFDSCILEVDELNGEKQPQGCRDEVALRLRLRKEARMHFEHLEAAARAPSSSSPLYSSTVKKDVSDASPTTVNGSLSLLLSALVPSFSSNSGSDSKVRALYCLMGALEGGQDLTQCVRQAVGTFLAGLCRPDRRQGDQEGKKGDVDANQHMDYVDAGNSSPEQVTRQLQAMERACMQQCHGSISTVPGRKSNSLNHDDVRDAAMEGLKALLHSHLEIFPAHQHQSRSIQSVEKAASRLTEAMGAVQESMELRLQLAMSSVGFRCQTTESKPDMSGTGMWGDGGAGYEFANVDMNIEDGLSKLPRSKRSLCFNLLEGALLGLKDDGTKWEQLWSRVQSQATSPVQNERKDILPSSLLSSMSRFVSLTSCCMHGETDPRCLLQLLRLLNKTQQILMPMFFLHGKKLGDTQAFPSVEIFDAVAPYYPIQFTPPKNDPHGITRGMLQDALMAVLCERGAVYEIEPSRKKEHSEKETMIILSARMFLERLEPPKSSDFTPPSNGANSEVEDKLCAVDDLLSLFVGQTHFPENGALAGVTGCGDHISLNAMRVAPDFLSELATSMARAHEEAVSSDARSLAGAIRKFSSSLAHNLESAPTGAGKDSSEYNTTSLWEAFVADIVKHLAPVIGSAPQGMHGRASTAYLASLAAGGGRKTLNNVLEECYPRFLRTLSSLDAKKSRSIELKNLDEEKFAAAMRGIAALISSCRVALQKYECEKKGARVHPHPLSSYISPTAQTIALVLNEPYVRDNVGPLWLAAVGALESFLTSGALSGLNEKAINSLEKTILCMAPIILNGEGENSEYIDQQKEACSRVLGAVIAHCLCQDNNTDKFVLNGCQRLIPEILSSATSSRSQLLNLHTMRYDWMILSKACADGPSKVATLVVSGILSKMISALKSSSSDPRVPAMALSYLVRHGGPGVGIAFHHLSSPGPSLLDMIQEMAKEPLQVGYAEGSIDNLGMAPTRGVQVGLSLLQLPDLRVTEEDEADGAIERASSIVQLVVPAFECPSALYSCNILVKFVDRILPPLSKWDELKLSLAFPLLAAVLQSSDKGWNQLSSDVSGTLRSMITDLAQFSISPDHHIYSRSYAVSCLFSILLHGNQDGKDEDDVQTLCKLLNEVAYPVVSHAMGCLEKDARDTLMTSNDSMHFSFSRLEDALSFMGVLGSAAACKGGPLSQAADAIASFFVELACTGTTQFPFTQTKMQLVSTNKTDPLFSPPLHAHILPASAFGSLISVHNGGPFWRQRMAHKTLPILLKALQMQAESQNPPALGTLAVTCHMLCCLPETIIGKTNIRQLLPTVIAGLVYLSKNLNSRDQWGRISPKPADMLPIILATLIKIISISPDDITKFVGIIIPSLLLLCSSVEPSDTNTPIQLLAFQCLETLAGHSQAHNSIMREKNQVIVVLSAAMDHPSIVIRNAVCQARNVWHTLE